jgi:hypothetical protein
MTPFSAFTCFIPSKEGVNTVSAISEPERINTSSQLGADPVEDMVYTCTPNKFCKKYIEFIRHNKNTYKLVIRSDPNTTTQIRIQQEGKRRGANTWWVLAAGDGPRPCEGAGEARPSTWRRAAAAVTSSSTRARAEMQGGHGRRKAAVNWSTP